ncbi:NUDIX hydrolase [Epibacterium sp. Ofav1-8]|uniref:NUDIX hydrolase n=1 Tax=Epibacterium sp. Ofav1-8 TaxID=2917735 RepID=UPI001EF7137B|nr:NUDIX hydrolase [Epibacterium sp. Ofav1-8]MCG7625611.1 NUDIX hydrolase [Epibacterium sp. Ofav1-8]
MALVLDVSDPQDDRQLHPQVGALCYRITAKGRVKVLLVTSRRTGRWIIPKGWPMDGKTAAEAATIEAWEEAGVRGQALDGRIGRFSYVKTRENATALACRVDVFPLRVRGLATQFPERGERRRAWMSLRRAAKQVAEPELAALLSSFAPPGP